MTHYDKVWVDVWVEEASGGGHRETYPTWQDAGQTAVTIHVNDAGEPLIVDHGFAIEENSVAGTVVGEVAADPTAVQPLSFAITAGNTGDAFAIDDAGQITVSNGAALDYETTPSFALTVQASDAGGRTGVATVTVRLTDAFEGSYTLDEHSPNGTYVGWVPMLGTECSFASGNTGEALDLSLTGGVITVNNWAALDYETTPTVDLTVSHYEEGWVDVWVDDGEGGGWWEHRWERQHMGDTAVSVYLNDVSDDPLILDQGFETDEASDSGTIVGALVTGPDGVGLLQYAITGGNLRLAVSNAPPTIDSLTGDTALVQTLTGAYSASGSDPGGDAITYEWDFGDGSEVVTGASVQHTFPAEGVYTVTLTLRDCDGAATSETLGVTVDSTGPGITAWGSAADHGSGVGEVSLLVADDSAFSEPRTSGVTRLLVQFSEAIDPASFTPAGIEVTGLSAPLNEVVDLNDIVITTSTRNADTIGVITFSQALPDRARYTVAVSGVTDTLGNALQGDNDRVLTALVGDASGDGWVNNTDVGGVRWTATAGPIDPDQPWEVRSDIDLDGQVTEADVDAVKALRGHDTRFVPVPTGEAVPLILEGDASLDGAVSGADLAVLAQNWNATGDATWSDGDFNADGAVSGADLATLASNWGAVGGATLAETGFAIEEGPAPNLLPVAAYLSEPLGDAAVVAPLSPQGSSFDDSELAVEVPPVDPANTEGAILGALFGNPLSHRLSWTGREQDPRERTRAAERVYLFVSREFLAVSPSQWSAPQAGRRSAPVPRTRPDWASVKAEPHRALHTEQTAQPLPDRQDLPELGTELYQEELGGISPLTI